MSDQKHNPLSSEELFRLLDKKTNTANEMDEFEQDALDGFAILGSSEKAKALVEEINTVISKKASGSDGKGTRKNRIIWFSAAASIVLIVMISIFFLKQSKQDSSKELALNEMSEKEELVSPNVQGSGETSPTPADAVNTNVKGTESNLMVIPKGIILSEKKVAESSAPKLKQPALLEGVVSFGAGKEVKDEDKSGEQKNKNDETQTKNAIVIADKLEVNKKTQTITEESELDQVYSVAQNSTKSQTNMDAAKELSKKEDTDSRNAEKSYKSKTKSNDAIVRSEMSTAAFEAPASANVARSEAAYYLRGELGIKEFVLTYLKSKKYANPITGKYKIKATVFTNGTIKVNSITQITKDNCNCTDKIKEVLNTMTQWNPSSNDGNKTQSEVEFVIGF
ncbi:MAG: hypothetical protein H7141_06730 [Burkholderiales bacterium]|nr:hypothetical protein [Bacteroidia bacterium]